MRFEAQKCQPHLFMIMAEGAEGYQLEDVTFGFIYLHRFSVHQGHILNILNIIDAMRQSLQGTRPLPAPPWPCCRGSRSP